MLKKLNSLKDAFFWKIILLISVVLVGFVSKSYKWNDSLDNHKTKTASTGKIIINRQ